MKFNVQLKRLFIAFIIFVIGSLDSNVNAQNEDLNQFEAVESIRLSGPRIGYTILTVPENYDGDKIYGLMQMGWQFEKRLFTSDAGDAVLFEFVPLIAGLERNLFLPSFTTLVGYRTKKGLEFGIGPNLSITGTSVAFAAGHTLKRHNFFIPINVSYTTNEDGGRVSLLVGFNGNSKKPKRKWQFW